MRKILALLLLSGSFALASGINCIPNVGSAFAGLQTQLNALLGR